MGPAGRLIGGLKGRRVRRPADPTAPPTDRRLEPSSPARESAFCVGYLPARAGWRRKRARAGPDHSAEAIARLEAGPSSGASRSSSPAIPTRG
jgi:hypothetical protein